MLQIRTYQNLLKTQEIEISFEEKIIFENMDLHEIFIIDD